MAGAGIGDAVEDMMAEGEWYEMLVGRTVNGNCRSQTEVRCWLL